MIKHVHDCTKITVAATYKALSCKVITGKFKYSALTSMFSYVIPIGKSTSFKSDRSLRPC